MEITLSKKKTVPVKINGKDCLICLDTQTIDNFQIVNKIGLNEAIDLMSKGRTTVIYKLICSMVRDKATGQILGKNFFKKFDEMDTIKFLQPVIMELLGSELPKAKNESEKK